MLKDNLKKTSGTKALGPDCKFRYLSQVNAYLIADHHHHPGKRFFSNFCKALQNGPEKG